MATAHRFTPETARHFDRFSVANAATVMGSLECGCEPYVDVFTYRRWQAQGMQVQKGQRSIRLPVIVHGTKKDKETGEESSISMRRTSAVFCRCQVAPK